jgi:hypothetical protein
MAAWVVMLHMLEARTRSLVATMLPMTTVFGTARTNWKPPSITQSTNVDTHHHLHPTLSTPPARGRVEPLHAPPAEVPCR